MKHILLDAIRICVEMEEIENYYNEKSKTYDETFSILYFRVFDAITWKYLEPYLPTTPNALVLDAGGGTGRWTVRIAKKALRVILMDTSEGMLKVAAQRIKQEDIEDNVVIKKGDITRTGYTDETFDLIFCEHALFLFKEPDALLEELTRILKTKATLIVSAHNRYVASLARLSDIPRPKDLKYALMLLLERRHQFLTPDSKVKVFTWTPNEFRTMLERHGFQIEKIIGKGMTMPLRISNELFTRKKYSETLFNNILQFELALCEKPDALALAGHMQAIAHKE
jgi:ubiquinone/menaquinone biosynthesis C-methylase UbiE